MIYERRKMKNYLTDEYYQEELNYISPFDTNDVKVNQYDLSFILQFGLKKQLGYDVTELDLQKYNILIAKYYILPYVRKNEREYYNQWHDLEKRLKLLDNKENLIPIMDDFRKNYFKYRKQREVLDEEIKEESKSIFPYYY